MCARSGMACHAPWLPKLPPLPCPEHSSRWPTVRPCARRLRSCSLLAPASVQPRLCTSGPRKSAASATRPVITMSAPASSASAMGFAPT
ncbi:hypothetical protein D9M68_852580 [compost metagenome]